MGLNATQTPLAVSLEVLNDPQLLTSYSRAQQSLGLEQKQTDAEQEGTEC